ncbi:MAG TPA: FtsQ-type POTRA domain-containing protein [Longimicrobiales bacterium]
MTTMREGAVRWVTIVGVAIVVVGTTAAAPAGLRRIGAFRVDRVEVQGARQITAQQVLASSGITRTTSVFDDAEAWRTKLLENPVIATAAVHRRLPNTVVIRITEATAVAFARTPELRPVDARGRVLPADPTYVDLDLPIIDALARVDGSGRVLDSATIRTAAILGRLQELEPVLAPWVSHATPMRDGARLALRGPASAEVLLPFDVDARRLHELRVTLADLAAAPGTDSTTASGLDLVTRIDVRFREQVVVSLHTAGTP